MELIRFAVIVVIGGLIGWITNKVAIKMLFRPVNPIHILGFKLQGVFPKRKDQMAISLADTIETELLSKDVILNQLLSEEKVEQLKTKLKATLLDKVEGMIPPMFKAFLGNNVKGMLADYLDKNGDELFEQLLDEFRTQGLESLDIHKIVKDRIDELDFIEFERIVFGLMNRELKHVEIIGLFLGMVIGVLQFFVSYLLA